MTKSATSGEDAPDLPPGSAATERRRAGHPFAGDGPDGRDRRLSELAEAIGKGRAILFVGAGASMSVGLPSWDDLIDHMVQELGLDPEHVARRQGSHQTLAEYYRLKRGSLAPLRTWLDSNWAVSREKVAGSRLHRLIVELGFPMIYTTNYDRSLETAFRIHARPFSKIANARDIARIRPGATQIVKFHGDFDDDSSLVLTETDYFDRLDFQSPLDMKFRADALGKTILFLGYSLSDMNIRLLLHRLWQTWQRSGCQDERPRSYVFMPRRNPVEEAVLQGWGITMLSDEDGRDAQSASEIFLERLLAICAANRRRDRPGPAGG